MTALELFEICSKIKREKGRSALWTVLSRLALLGQAQSMAAREGSNVEGVFLGISLSRGKTTSG